MERNIDRFDKYLKHKWLSDNKVTLDLGLSVGTLGKSRKENRDLSNRNIELILKFYKDLNRTWLLTGEGEMLKEAKESLPERNTESRLLDTIEKMADAGDRNSRSIEKMVENASVDSRNMSKLIDLLYSKGIEVPSYDEYHKKGESEDHKRHRDGESYTKSAG